MGEHKTTRAYRAVGVLCLSSVLEAMRSRLVWVSLVFSGLLIFASIAGASVALYEQSRLIVDIGMAAASIVGTAVALSMTLVFFAQELSQHTAYVTLARPIGRWTWLLGKFCGLWIALWTVVGIMGVSTAGVVLLFHAALPPAFWGGIFLTGIEMGVVISLALCLVTLCAPGLAAAYATALLVASNMSPDIIAMADRQHTPWLSRALWGLFYVLPDLSKLSLRPYVANALPMPDQFVALGTLYGLSWTALFLLTGMLVFERRQSL